MDDWQPPADSQGYTLKRLYIALIIISSIIIITRLSVRAFIVRALGLDDLLATIGFGLITAFAATEIIGVEYGSGTHIEDIPSDRLVKWFSMLSTQVLLFFLSLGAVRLSVVAFFPRLGTDKWFRIGIWIITFLIIAITMIACFYFLTNCKYIPHLWDVAALDRDCRDTMQSISMMWIHGAMGVFIDLCLLGLPVSFIRLRMKFSPKLAQVILVFSVGIFAAITGIVRLVVNATTDFAIDGTYKMIYLAPWSQLECHVGLWTACFPAMQPLFRYLGHYTGLWSTDGGSGSSFLMNNNQASPVRNVSAV